MRVRKKNDTWLIKDQISLFDRYPPLLHPPNGTQEEFYFSFPFVYPKLKKKTSPSSFKQRKSLSEKDLLSVGKQIPIDISSPFTSNMKMNLNVQNLSSPLNTKPVTARSDSIIHSMRRRRKRNPSLIGKERKSFQFMTENEKKKIFRQKNWTKLEKAMDSFEPKHYEYEFQLKPSSNIQKLSKSPPVQKLSIIQQPNIQQPNIQQESIQEPNIQEPIQVPNIQETNIQQNVKSIFDKPPEVIKCDAFVQFPSEDDPLFFSPREVYMICK